MGESVKPEIHAFDTLRDASRALAERIVETARAAVDERGQFSMALSGGRTPELLYNLLANEYSDMMGWNAIHLFWGDERYVPPDHPDSNFRMAHHAWISKVPIPPENIHCMQTEKETPEKAAESYERILIEFFKASEKMPDTTFDVMLLGIGIDGHTASLFPGSPALSEKGRWVVSAEAPASVFPKKRITLTLPVINNSREVFFLAFGEEKKNVIKAILEEAERARRAYPAAMVSARERLLWYVDKNVYCDVS
ncbi:MAG: 6-phosphogluconolactonase [Candidatus Aminicenantes bacterium]|jgi:6-phosphogluconolactonase